MPDIRPFKGILYNSKKNFIPDVVAPPYDVISPEQQAQLYDKNPYNIVRLILGREQNRYISAAQYFTTWVNEKILLQDEEPSIYVLAQTFHHGGKEIRRSGFVAACRLEEFGKGSVFPHEKTYPGPKADRLQLFESTNAMFSQIFGLYADPNHRLDKFIQINDPPDVEVEFDGVQNQLWRLGDPIAVASIQEFIKNEKIFVADGHHRYETALHYRDAKRLNNPDHNGREPYNFVPMFLTNMLDAGLLILPTHRLLHDLKGFDPVAFLNDLKQYFHTAAQTSEEELLQNLEKKQSQSFGLVFSQNPSFVLIWLKKESMLNIKEVAKTVLQLDVELLHSFVLKHILHLSDDSQQAKLHLGYEHDAMKAIHSVRRGEAQMAFLMNPTRIEQVRAIALSGDSMPQKSTFFYPKLLSGLVMYSFVSG